MVESLLRSLKKDEALQGPLSARILDQGDAVGAWTAPRLAAILFPTPETLKQARVDLFRHALVDDLCLDTGRNAGGNLVWFLAWVSESTYFAAGKRDCGRAEGWRFGTDDQSSVAKRQFGERLWDWALEATVRGLCSLVSGGVHPQADADCRGQCQVCSTAQISFCFCHGS